MAIWAAQTGAQTCQGQEQGYVSAACWDGVWLMHRIMWKEGLVIISEIFSCRLHLRQMGIWLSPPAPLSIKWWRNTSLYCSGLDNGSHQLLWKSVPLKHLKDFKYCEHLMKGLEVFLARFITTCHSLSQVNSTLLFLHSFFCGLIAAF